MPHNNSLNPTGCGWGSLAPLVQSVAGGLVPSFGGTIEHGHSESPSGATRNMPSAEASEGQIG